MRICWIGSSARRSGRATSGLLRYLRRVDSSNSSNTNKILWGAKFPTPSVDYVRPRLSSMNAAWFSQLYPTQKCEPTGTLSLNSAILDSTKPAGASKISYRTIVHYLAKYSDKIIQKKLALLPPDCPLLQEKEKSCFAGLPVRLGPTDHACIQERITVVSPDASVRAAARYLPNNPIEHWQEHIECPVSSACVRVCLAAARPPGSHPPM